MSPARSRTDTNSPAAALANRLIDQIEELLLTADQAGQPLELDPHRGRLFELFVMADAGGFLEEDAEQDLTCDEVGRNLASRWNLSKGIGPSALSQPGALPPGQLAKLRLLWSFMRMWMEWTYAWKRWKEFHRDGEPATPGD